MRLHPVAVISTVLLSACAGGGITFTGTGTEKLFPFDGERTWTYQSQDETLPFLLDGEMISEPERIGGVNVYTINYFKDCQRDDPTCTDGDLLFALRMSNTQPEGVFIYGYDPGDGNVDLDPPVLLAYNEVKTQEIVETTTGGRAFETEYLGMTTCQGYIVTTVEWDCHGFDIRADAPIFPLTGTIQAVGGQGIVNFTFTDDPNAWRLLDSQQDGADGQW